MKKNRKKSYISVYVNDSRLGEIKPGTLAAAKLYIKHNLLSTHMGQWYKTAFGYEYNTTIGKYYRFIKLYER